MVKSANDVAWAIGENLGGSVEGFAADDERDRPAHRHAREPLDQPERPAGRPPMDLGPRHGGPRPRADPRFPRQPRPCSRSARSSSAARSWPTTTACSGRYAGADGMKTGFICSGGFNVVASATRNGRRILTVVMGQPSARERDLKAADLFDYGFSQSAGLGRADPRRACRPPAISEPPDMRPYICDRRSRCRWTRARAPSASAGRRRQRRQRQRAADGRRSPRPPRRWPSPP